MSEKSNFNTSSPKGPWTFGIGLTGLKLIFLACINVKYYNLKHSALVLLHFGWYDMLKLHDFSQILISFEIQAIITLKLLDLVFTSDLLIIDNFKACTNTFLLETK